MFWFSISTFMLRAPKLSAASLVSRRRLSSQFEMLSLISTTIVVESVVICFSNVDPTYLNVTADMMMRPMATIGSTYMSTSALTVLALPHALLCFL